MLPARRSPGLHDRLEAGRIRIAVERFPDVLEVVATRHHRVEIDGAAGDQVDGCGPGVGVAEHAGEVDLVVGDVGDGQRVLVGTHADQHDVPGRTHGLDAAAHGGGHPGRVDE